MSATYSSSSAIRLLYAIRLSSSCSPIILTTSLHTLYSESAGCLQIEVVNSNLEGKVFLAELFQLFVVTPYFVASGDPRRILV